VNGADAALTVPVSATRTRTAALTPDGNVTAKPPAGAGSKMGRKRATFESVR
jgi:hypothetical protein